MKSLINCLALIKELLFFLSKSEDSEQKTKMGSYMEIFIVRQILV